MPVLATPAQINLIHKLVAERANLYAALGEVTASDAISGWDVVAAIDGMTKAQASKSISAMLDTNKSMKLQVQATRPAQAAVTALEPGMYRVDGNIYKVQKARNGAHMYAKLLTLIDTGSTKDDGSIVYRGSFEFAPGMMRVLRAEHRMTLAQAQEFGSNYSTCCNCGRTLSAAQSVAEGIGPICSSRFLSD